MWKENMVCSIPDGCYADKVVCAKILLANNNNGEVTVSTLQQSSYGSSNATVSVPKAELTLSLLTKSALKTIGLTDYEPTKVRGSLKKAEKWVCHSCDQGDHVFNCSRNAECLGCEKPRG